jgi:OB-fold nucleic acid binding domain
MDAELFLVATRTVASARGKPDTRANGIVATAADDGPKSVLLWISRVRHEHWPASNDVLPGSSIQTRSKTSVRFASGAGRTIHAGSRVGKRSGASGDSEGFVFLSLEDETGISNVIVNPDLYEKYLVVTNREKFIRVEGVLQNRDHTISIKASRVLSISIASAETQSHDFHSLRHLFPVCSSIVENACSELRVALGIVVEKH